MDNKILKTALVNWKDLKLFQPTDLKKMSKSQLDKLKTSLKQNGFKTPFYVWDNGKELFCLDGHHRIPVLKLLETEGESIPAKLPANFVHCKDKKDAKKAVLIFNSHYADIQQDSLIDWIKDLNFDDINSQIDIDIKDIDFDNINSTEDREKTFKEQEVTCPHCEQSFMVKI